MDKAEHFIVTDFDQVSASSCPCGSSRRLFQEESGGRFSLHRVTMRSNPQVHYHRKNTEIYYVLQGCGTMELDESRVPVGPGKVVMIRPGCRHRLVPDGEMEILNFCIPAFSAEDEYTDCM